jgi:hypothetical protein
MGQEYQRKKKSGLRKCATLGKMCIASKSCQQKCFLLLQLGAGDQHLVKAPRKLGHNIFILFYLQKPKHITYIHTYIVVKWLGTWKSSKG